MLNIKNNTLQNRNKLNQHISIYKVCLYSVILKTPHFIITTDETASVRKGVGLLFGSKGLRSSEGLGNEFHARLMFNNHLSTKILHLFKNHTHLTISK